MKYIKKRIFVPYDEIRDAVHSQVDFEVYSALWRDLVIPIRLEFFFRDWLNERLFYIFNEPKL